MTRLRLHNNLNGLDNHMKNNKQVLRRLLPEVGLMRFTQTVFQKKPAWETLC